MNTLGICGNLRSTLAEVEACGWQVVSTGSADGMFVTYDYQPPQMLPPGLRIIGTNTSMPTWHERRVPVITTRDDVIQRKLWTITPTAEFVIGQMMYLHRQLCRAACQSWAPRDEHLAPKMLSRMRMLIIGLGRLGQMVRQIAGALGMEIMINDPKKCGASTSLDEALPWADVVVVAAHTEKCILTASRLATLLPSALVVSISHPCAVDGDVAVQLVLDGRLRGLALDCHDIGLSTASEPRFFAAVADGRLLLTSHIAGSTEDARRETEQMILHEMRRRLP